MAQPKPLFVLESVPGVRRDGTDLDSSYYSDVVWTRFQRGRPRKMGGFAQLSAKLNAPIRSVFVNGHNGVISAHYLGQWGIQRQQLAGGGATGVVDRTPLGFVANSLYTWSQAVLYSSTGGSYAALVAASSPDVEDITSDVGGGVYVGEVDATAPFTVVSDGVGPLSVSGGVCVMQPFLVVYGSDGLIRNSNANDYSAATGWTTGGANYAASANVSGTKIVYGAPVRGGGQSPAALFWSLDALIRMSFVGGTRIWTYDTISHPTSILSKKCVVEHDGKFFWIGNDRFLFYNGVVQELPNQMNSNDFFDNLNYDHRNKVWGTKVARYGEIWWFYPRGADTECKNAVIFNYLENTWYEAVLQRSAGSPCVRCPQPVWAGNEDSTATTALPIGVTAQLSAQTLAGSATLTFAAAPGTYGIAVGQKIYGHPGLPSNAAVSAIGAFTVTMSGGGGGVATANIPAATALVFSSMTTLFVEGQTVTGGTSGATATVSRVTDTVLNVVNVTGTFNSAEALTGGSGASARTLGASYAQTLTSVYRHEYGVDKVANGNVSALRASFTTCNFGFAAAGPFAEVPQTLDINTRLTRVEPDFRATGNLVVSVLGRSYANQEEVELYSEEVSPGTPFISPRAQERLLKLKVESNVVGGNFQAGQTLLLLEPGDVRGNV